jgi:hypothetical protein
MQPRLDAVQLLAIANTASVVAAIFVGWEFTGRYREPVYSFKANNVQHTADVAVDELAWSEHVRLVGDIGRNIAQADKLHHQT